MRQSELPKPDLAGRDGASIAVFLLIAALALAGDLAMKAWAFANVAGHPVVVTQSNATDPRLIPPHPAFVIVPHILSLKLTLNRGAVFGIGAGGRVFFIVITFVAVAVVLGIFWRTPRRQRLMQIGLALVLAGALGNLYDRVFFGVVRDMMYLFPGVNLPFGLTWPGGNREVYPWIFNIADAALCIGVAMILLILLRKPRIETRNEHSANPVNTRP